MTDLATANLKQLLDQSTPGSWEFREEEEWDHVAGPEWPPMLTYLEHIVEDSDGKCLFGNSNDKFLEDYPGNLRLASLAPQLAQEVIRLRAQPELPALSSDCASIEVPTRRTLIMDDADCPTLYEDEDSILVGIVNGEVELSLGIHDEISVTLLADKARGLAVALLAAANYAEENQCPR